MNLQKFIFSQSCLIDLLYPTIPSLKVNNEDKALFFFTLRIYNCICTQCTFLILSNHPTPLPGARCNTESIFKQTTAGLNSKFSSPKLVALPLLKNPIFPINS